MFADRLITMLKNLIIIAIGLSAALGLAYGLMALPHNIGSWMALITVLLMLLVGLIGFIHWLIIEPIKYSRWYQRYKSKKKQ